MSPKTDAQRRAEADARKRAAGLVRVSVWVPAENRSALLKFGKIFCEAKEQHPDRDLFKVVFHRDHARKWFVQKYLYDTNED